VWLSVTLVCGELTGGNCFFTSAAKPAADAVFFPPLPAAVAVPADDS